MENNSNMPLVLDDNIKKVNTEQKLEKNSLAQNPRKGNFKKIIIIGGGACGMAAATKIRRQSNFEINVFSSDSHTAYSHCGIPFVLGREIGSFEKLIVKSPDFFKKNSINVKLNETVKLIDLNSRVVKTVKGIYPFDELVIATGSLPFIPRNSCANILPYGIFTLRNLSDGIRLGKTLERAERACIVGGGTIGIECAVAFARRGIKTVLINRNKNLLSRQLDPDIENILRTHLESLGIEIVAGEPVSVPENFWKEKMLHIGDKQFPADFILISSGVRPEISLAKQAGIEVGKAGGIIVNEMLQVKAGNNFLPYVYAGGECAEVTDFVTGETKLSQLGTTARRMADVIGNNITGKNTTFGARVDPWVAVAGELQFGGVGITSKKAENHGMQLVTGLSRGRTRASYYPGKKDLFIKLLFKDNFLVGAQLAGGEGIKERIDALSFAIRKKATIQDLLESETCYTPPVSMLVDPILPAVKAAIRNLKEKGAKDTNNTN